MHSNPKKCALGVEITQNRRQNRAEELQNVWNFGAPRAQNLRAIGQRTHGVAAAVDRVGSALTSEEGARQEPR